MIDSPITAEEAQGRAQVIKKQLGNAFGLITGATNFLYEIVNRTDVALRFKLPSQSGYTKDGINFVKIIDVQPRDTYDIEFGRVDPLTFEYKEVKKYTDVYVENLHGIIRDTTGLATRF